jgi:ABC-2 type transport system ATP-binding protein/lipopolysaccharide transport system ATP-binding protein
VRVLPADGKAGRALLRGDPLRIEVEFNVADDLPGLDMAINVTSSTGARVLDEALSDQLSPNLPVGRYRAELVVPPVLNFGDYTVGVWFGTVHEDVSDEPVAAAFTVHGSDRDRPERMLVLDLPFVVHTL